MAGARIQPARFAGIVVLVAAVFTAAQRPVLGSWFAAVVVGVAMAIGAAGLVLALSMRREVYRIVVIVLGLGVVTGLIAVAVTGGLNAGVIGQVVFLIVFLAWIGYRRSRRGETSPSDGV